MKHHMKSAMSHLNSHHSKGDDHHRAHGGHCGGEKVHFNAGHPGKGKNMGPGSPAEGRKLTREEED